MTAKRDPCPKHKDADAIDDMCADCWTDWTRRTTGLQDEIASLRARLAEAEAALAGAVRACEAEAERCTQAMNDPAIWPEGPKTDAQMAERQAWVARRGGARELAKTIRALTDATMPEEIREAARVLSAPASPVTVLPADAEERVIAVLERVPMTPIGDDGGWSDQKLASAILLALRGEVRRG